jgi:hypothetical protein
MTRQRTTPQILAAARAIDRARVAGVPGEVLAIMLTARAAHAGEGQWPDRLDLARVVACHEARAVDEVLWRAIKNRVRG